MSILDYLGSKKEAKNEKEQSGTETVRRIVRELEALEPKAARHLAAFSYILSRVANADFDISETETRKMEEIVQRFGGIPEEQAVLVVEIAKSRNRLFGGTEDFLVTREFKEIATQKQRRELLDCLFAVSAADDSISSAEEAQIWQIASELDFDHADYVTARSAYSSKREVLKSLKKPVPE
ncbi:MAG: TerB family tellurite resistance protein [Pseudomonadota bacterium]